MTEIEKALEAYFQAVHQDRDYREQHAALLAAITRREAEVRAEALKEAAKVADKIHYEQAVCLQGERAAGAAQCALNIRSLITKESKP